MTSWSYAKTSPWSLLTVLKLCLHRSSVLPDGTCRSIFHKWPIFAAASLFKVHHKFFHFADIKPQVIFLAYIKKPCYQSVQWWQEFFNWKLFPGIVHVDTILTFIKSLKLNQKPQAIVSVVALLYIWSESHVNYFPLPHSHSWHFSAHTTVLPLLQQSTDISLRISRLIPSSMRYIFVEQIISFRLFILTLGWTVFTAWV